MSEESHARIISGVAQALGIALTATSFAPVPFLPAVVTTLAKIVDVVQVTFLLSP